MHCSVLILTKHLVWTLMIPLWLHSESKENFTEITANRKDLKSSVSAGKGQEQQLLGTSNIFFSRDETITAKLPAMSLIL